MNVLVVLMPISIGLGLAGLAVFVWTLRARQYDDPEGDSVRLLDPRWDDRPMAPPKTHEAPGPGA
ncbi:cytochrome oxidase maturation protein, cbb3-type [Brevirhabdus pacifica]|uniref:Cytochrome oxidase maturation protein, cbb3-type n=1 Tax=Brevirhabdus pacifica TaxID=1267768 RepID=A0A1U7DLN6_9RHOB|nr:cbb3-type cytochrome oxidase assembly protein CcoS [Brevirhabdus pacifica]APX90803.1 cytochrome oxidase maturation protein, cbb3-type [Brevirhabdus pacifica]OWU79585.1 cytochrome c oxidase subunit II [Loktanella sp. 22II-4b]PJJ87312.1 cbb3-type cytochrome oxidase maturation protein [Brevirhabdus pacifica]